VRPPNENPAYATGHSNYSFSISLGALNW